MPRADTTLVTAGHVGEVTALAFGPTDELIATGGEDGALRLWSIGTAQPLASLAIHRTEVGCVTFSQDGEYVVSSDLDRVATITRVQPAALVRRVPLGRGVGTLSALDDDCVVAGCATGDIIAFSVPSGRRRLRWRHGAGVNALCIKTGTGSVVSGGEDGRVCVWRVGRATPVKVLRYPAAVHSVALTENGCEVVVAGDAPVIQRFDLYSGKCLGQMESRELAPPLAVSPMTGDILFGQPYGALLRASPKDGYRSRRIATVSGFWERLVAAHNRPLLLTASSEPPCCALRTLSGKTLQRFDHHVGSVLCIAPHPRRPVFLTGGTDTTVRWHDLRRPTSPTVVAEPRGKVFVLAWPGGGCRVYVGDLDGELSAWDVRTRRVCWRTPLGDRTWRQLIHQGRYLAVLDDRGEIVVLRSNDGHLLHAIGSVCPGVQTQGIGFVPGRPILLLGTTRGLWELELAGRWVGRTRVLTRDLEVSELVVAPSGTCFGLEKATGTIWEWSSGADKGRLRRFSHAKNHTGLRLSPDGRRLLAADNDGLRVWDTSSRRLIRRLAQKGIEDADFLAGSADIVVAPSATSGRVRVIHVTARRTKHESSPQ